MSTRYPTEPHQIFCAVRHWNVSHGPTVCGVYQTCAGGLAIDPPLNSGRLINVAFTSVGISVTSLCFAVCLYSYKRRQEHLLYIYLIYRLSCLNVFLFWPFKFREGGKETIQLYAADTQTAISHINKQLKSWRRLGAGENERRRGWLYFFSYRAGVRMNTYENWCACRCMAFNLKSNAED